MNKVKLLKKIENELRSKAESKKMAEILCDSPLDFQEIIMKWADGQENDYVFNEISLEMICQKEQCSYFRALLRMQLLLKNPNLAADYKKWVPVNKDWNRR